MIDFVGDTSSSSIDSIFILRPSKSVFRSLILTGLSSQSTYSLIMTILCSYGLAARSSSASSGSLEIDYLMDSAVFSSLITGSSFLDEFYCVSTLCITNPRLSAKCLDDYFLGVTNVLCLR